MDTISLGLIIFLSSGKCECATLTTSAETEEESKYLQDKLIEGGKR